MHNPFRKVEDRPTPSEVYNWRVYMSALVASFATFCYGYDGAFIGGTLALASFKQAFGINASNSAYLSTNIVTVYQAGAFWGSLFAFPVTEKYGRRTAIVAAGWIFSIGAAIQLAARGPSSLPALYVGRVIAGMGIGFISLSVPIYISELSPPAIRGRLIAFYEICLQAGALLGFFINFGVNKHMAPGRPQWTVPIAVQLIPGGLLIIFCPFLKESPRWLRSKKRNDQAHTTLAWLRHLPMDHPYLIEELAMIDAQLEVEEKKHKATLGGGLKELFSRKLRWRLALCIMLAMFQNVTGINAINYYSPTVFAQVGVVGTSAGLLSTGIFGVIKCAVTVVWAFILIDVVGRRPLFLIGSAGAAVTMCGITGLLETNTVVTGGGISPKSQAAVAFLYLFTAFYGPTWNGGPWVVTAEIFPTHVRALAIALYAAFGNWLFTFVISRATPYMFRAWGSYVFLFFGLGSACGFVFVWFFVPETKNIPLERMDEVFGWHGDEDAKDLEQRRIQELQGSASPNEKDEAGSESRDSRL